MNFESPNTLGLCCGRAHHNAARVSGITQPTLYPVSYDATFYSKNGGFIFYVINTASIFEKRWCHMMLENSFFRTYIFNTLWRAAFLRSETLRTLFCFWKVTHNVGYTIARWGRLNRISYFLILLKATSCFK